MLAVAGLALAGCTDDDDAEPTDSEPEATSPTGEPGSSRACDLFTEEDAEEVLGAAVERQQDTAGSEASVCSYVDEADPTRVLEVAAGDFASEDEAENAFLRARADAQFDGLTIEDVEDLGDEAYWLPETTNRETEIDGESLVFGELDVRAGTRLLTVFVAPSSLDRAIAIAGRAMSD